jgi:hypothetical protein
LAHRELTYREIAKEFPGRCPQAIKSAFKYHRIKKRPRSLKRTGFALLDQIRDEFVARNMSMRDLDIISGTGTYFRRAAWLTNSRPSPKKLVMAVHALEGDLLIIWK